MIIYCQEIKKNKKASIGLIQTRVISEQVKKSCSYISTVFWMAQNGGEVKKKPKKKKAGRIMKKDGLKSASAKELCWPKSRLSGDDISKAIKGDDSRQAGSDWQG